MRMLNYDELFQLIRGRRSIGRVKETAVSKECVMKLLAAGTWAPSHHQTEPWKFFVLEGESRNRLGEVLAEIYKQNLKESPLTEEEKRKMELQKKKPLRAPVIITIAAVPSDKPQVVHREEMAAACCTVQNMLLAAQALGLGAIWRTGEATYHPLMKQFFGLREEDEVLGFIYLGYPDMPVKEGKRISVEDKTVWMQ
jgi:nitroreductase